ncbi:MgtC/SapB family protein [Sphingomonas sp.]|uniref:MgtC/SapB family protein n=1 Tax=Sphingomonas sp. TaxID=28214 RepID=UPI002FC5F735
MSTFTPEAATVAGATAAASNLDDLLGLALALGIGLLIGIERGWRTRDDAPGERVAGVRTFTLIGLIGGLIGLELSGHVQALGLILALGTVAAIAIGYHADMRKHGNVSATSAIAAVLTLGLGTMAGSGSMAVAALGAGATVILLASREALHRALAYTSEADIRAMMRLVLVVFIILPLLPDIPLGPYGLNPRRLWTVVVITGSISFVGYVLIRIFGGRRGVMLTALVGALVSSTAVTLECARRLRAGEAVAANQAAIAAASTIMMIRAVALVAALVPHIFTRFVELLLLALIVSIAASALLFLRSNRDDEPTALVVKPPDLKLALLFGALVALMATAAGWAEQQAAGSGAAVVILGGLFDVDSAIAALGVLPEGTLPTELAALAVAAPVVFNTLLKLVLALVIAGPSRAWPAALALGLPAAAIIVSGIIAVA